jgi:hypothetical protein
MPLYKARAPALPLPPINYEQAQQDQFQNALRLYFNRLDNFLSELSGNQGGGLIGFPYISASDSTDQLATASNTPTVVTWNTLESGNGFTLNAPGSATALVSGIYKITYSLQLTNTDNAAHDAAVWLKVDTGAGFVDVPRSTTLFTVPARKSAGVFSYVCAYSEVVFTLNAGDEMELYWATNQAYDTSPATDGVYIEALAAQTSPYVRPATPSALGSITFVSAIPT